jgi:hypothetical protein
MMEQLCFEWTPGAAPTTGREEQTRYRMHLALRRAVVRWLLESEKPTGMAVGVITRIAKFRADVAAFWSRPVRNPQDEGPTQLLVPCRTAILQSFLTREECWPDCSRSGELVPRLRELKQRLHDLEAAIRRQEPELRDGGALFEEYAVWRYEDSRNREYHRLKRDIEKTEHALYEGTQFERIRQAALADQLHLAVPSGLIQPEELADGWGLLWVDDDLTVRQVLAPQPRDCHQSHRMHLVQNIAAAGGEAVRFALGLREQADGHHLFVQPPRGHRRAQPLTLRG